MVVFIFYFLAVAWLVISGLEFATKEPNAVETMQTAFIFLIVAEVIQ